MRSDMTPNELRDEYQVSLPTQYNKRKDGTLSHTKLDNGAIIYDRSTVHDLALTGKLGSKAFRRAKEIDDAA